MLRVGDVFSYVVMLGWVGGGGGGGLGGGVFFFFQAEDGIRDRDG